MTKQELRKNIKQQVLKLSDEERRSQALHLFLALSSDSKFLNATRVLIYNPLPDEIDVLPILEAFKESKQFFMPVVCGNILKILPYTEEQRMGAFNISEPVGSDFVNISDIDLVIVPGVGFSTDGCRLGRGKGFYDKLLAGASSHKIGVCFSCQIEDSIAALCEPHDIRMDEVIFP